MQKKSSSTTHNFDVLILGGGLGGLLTGSLLIDKDFKIGVLERLPNAGGRFTNIVYKGHTLSTGALHTVPYGNKGTLSKALKKAGVDVKLIDCVPNIGTYFDGEVEHPWNTTVDIVKSLKGARKRLHFLRLLLPLCLFCKDKEITLDDWFHKKSNDEEIYRILINLSRFTMSLDGDEVSAYSVGKLLWTAKNKGPAVVKGGCKSVIDALEKKLNENGVQIEVKCDVVKIGHDGDFFKVAYSKDGVRKESTCKYLVSNIGPHKTVEISEGLFPKSFASGLGKPVGGIKINVSSKKSKFDHSGIMFPANTERVAGMIEVTRSDSSLAPKGKHLLMAHQHLKEGYDIKNEIKLGIDDMKKLLKDFEKDCEVLLVQTYNGALPVNHLGQHAGIPVKSPVENLFFVGDFVDAKGEIMVERVAKSSLEAYNRIMRRTK